MPQVRLRMLGVSLLYTEGNTENEGKVREVKSGKMNVEKKSAEEFWEKM